MCDLPGSLKNGLDVLGGGGGVSTNLEEEVGSEVAHYNRTESIVSALDCSIYPISSCFSNLFQSNFQTYF